MPGAGSLVAVVVLAGCGRIGFSGRDGDPGAVDAAPGASDGTCVGAWSPPQPVPELNSIDVDWGPELTADEKTIYFHTNRPGGLGGEDIWVAQRTAIGQPFSPPQAVPVVNSTSTDKDADLARGETRMYLVSDRTGSEVIMVSSWIQGAWTTPVGVNGLGTTPVGPAVSDDDLEMFFSDDEVLTLATRDSTASPWSVVGPVTELEVPGVNDGFASLTADQRTIFFETSRDGNARIYTATRAGRGSSFSAPTEVVELNQPGTDSSDPDISGDGNTIYFGSDRATIGFADIYISTRTSCR